MNQKVQEFVSWALTNMAELRTWPADEVANVISNALLRVDNRLGVEVSEGSVGGGREIIITAYSDRELFPTVHQIVDKIPNVPGWRFVALKPPRGFDFVISLGNNKINANVLSFSPIPDINNGIQLLIPHALYAKFASGGDIEELAWLIVETGIGEELSSKLQHIEFSSSETVQKKKPITELNKYLGHEDDSSNIS